MVLRPWGSIFTIGVSSLASTKIMVSKSGKYEVHGFFLKMFLTISQIKAEKSINGKVRIEFNRVD